MIKGGGKSSGLMGFFPSRAHLSLPNSKTLSSPPPHSLNRRPHRRSVSKLSGNLKKNVGEVRKIAEEPTSPKVTCAGQIKIRPSKRGGTKTWQSLMAEIEKIHRSKSQSKFFGIKKDVMGFLACLRHLRLDFRCSRAVPPVDVVISDEEEEDEDEEEEEEYVKDESSDTLFSKWLLILREKENADEIAVPPRNALLLMRASSEPIKKWLEEEKRIEQSPEEGGERKDLSSFLDNEENINEILKSYNTDYYKLSPDIANETWVVGKIHDRLCRTRSWDK